MGKHLPGSLPALDLCADVCILRSMIIECQAQTNAHMTKNAAISVRVQDRVKKALEKAAEDDSRPLASLVEKVLTDWLKAKGLLK